MSIYKEDQQEDFGKWKDYISKLMYKDSTEFFLRNINNKQKIYDYGGGNGLLKDYFLDYKSVDIDHTKKPDIVANILNYQCQCKLIILRYVLHYMDDLEVSLLFKKILSYHKGQILIIQFYNENKDLKIKREISNQIQETNKTFRTLKQIKTFLTEYKIISEEEITYNVNQEFYINRFNLTKYNSKSHKESIVSLLIQNK